MYDYTALARRDLLWQHSSAHMPALSHVEPYCPSTLIVRTWFSESETC